MDQLDLVVERPILRRRKQRQGADSDRAAGQALDSRILDDQRTCSRIWTNHKPKRRIFQHDLVRPRIRRKTKHGRSQHRNRALEEYQNHPL